MTTRKWLRPTLAGAGIAAAAVAALALPAGAAVSVQSQSPSVAMVKLGNTATLDAKGAVLFAPTKVTCPSGWTAYVNVAVSEAVGSKIASGQASQSITCTGAVQKLQVAVTPTQQAFKSGVAYGEASVTVCVSDGCYTGTDQRDIQVTKP